MKWNQITNRISETEDGRYAIELKPDSFQSFKHFIVYVGDTPVVDSFGCLEVFTTRNDAKQFVADHIATMETAR